MACGPRSSGRTESGVALVALMAGVTIALLAMSAAVPTWRYIMKDDREEELIFRGGQIADAVQRYQKKNGNAPPMSLEMLVKGKYLRKLYKDPMTKDGKWRLVRQGGAGGPQPGAGRGGGAGGSRAGGGNAPGLAETPDENAPSFAPPESQGFQGSTSGPGASNSSGGPAASGGVVGAFVGVASRSTEKALRVVNGRTRYNEWTFVAGQPIFVGKVPKTVPPPRGLSPSPNPSASPSPTRSPSPEP